MQVLFSVIQWQGTAYTKSYSYEFNKWEPLAFWTFLVKSIQNYFEKYLQILAYEQKFLWNPGELLL